MKLDSIIRILLVVCLHYPLFTSISEAQSSGIFNVQIGEVPVEVLPQKAQYRFADFGWGKVTFMDGQTANAQVNYNLLYGEMQFIDRTKDTLSIADDPIVKTLTVNDFIFYYDPRYGYVEEVKDFTTCTLAKKQRLRWAKEVQKTTGGAANDIMRGTSDNRLSQTSSSWQANDKQTSQEFFSHSATKPMTFSLRANYYFTDFNHRWYPANKSSIKKAFRRYKKDVLEFIDTEEIKFNDAQDLIKLLSFCSQLKDYNP
ncbi:MAG: hypothetical protein WBA23_22155 [Tunicatimonas sp.]